MQKRIAALLLALCLSLTCAMGALAEGPNDQELTQTVEEKAPEQGTDTVDKGADEELSMSVTVDGETETGQNAVAVKEQNDTVEQDDTVPVPTQADGETALDTVADAAQFDADTGEGQVESEPQPITTAETPQDPNAGWRQKALAALAEADFSDWGSMRISSGINVDTFFTGEPVRLRVSFDELAGLAETDNTVNDYLSRTLTERTGMPLNITTLEYWYRDDQLILFTRYQGYAPANDETILRDTGFYGYSRDFYFTLGFVPVQPGNYRVEIQTTVDKSDDPMRPYIYDKGALQNAGMPKAEFEFTVAEAFELGIEGVPGSGVTDEAAATTAIQDAFYGGFYGISDTSRDVHRAAADGKEITVELTVQDTEAPKNVKLFTDKFDGQLDYKNIGIMVKADGEDVGPVVSTNTPIDFALDLPADAKPIVVRVLREHNDTVDELPFRTENGKVYFSTDKFSTYAIGTTNDLAYAAVQPVGNQIYTGKEIEPDVTVTINGNETLEKGVDYDVEYEDQVEPGVATVKIVGKNGFTGTAYLYFNIVKPAPSAPAGNDGGNSGSVAPAAKDTSTDEYIVCEACGHHFWEPYLDGWRCTTCGHLRGTTGVPADAAAKAAKAANAAYRGTIPQTADEFPLGGAIAVFGISLVGLGALLLLRKKQR